MVLCIMRKPAMRNRALLPRRRPAYLRVERKGRAAAADALDERRKGTEMNLVTNFRNWRKYRETYNELARMTQRELQDLGINRADIGEIARRSVGY